jgi:hypothetical protein
MEHVVGLEVRNKKFLIWFFVAISILAAPAVTIRILSSYNNAPYLLPLSQTQENTDLESGLARIDVQVDWGQDWPGTMTQVMLRDVIVTSLDAQTDRYNVDFETSPGERVEITFIVGHNKYGPVHPQQLAGAIFSAVSALRLANR